MLRTGHNLLNVWSETVTPVNAGKIVATGTPEEIVRVRKSYTGQALKAVLN